MIERMAEPITAQEFELVTSSWEPRKLVRFCNTLIACYAEGLKSEIHLTEQIYAQDRGVDAELFVHDPHLKEESLGLVGPGRTVYQFKQRNVIRPDKSRVIDSLKVAEEARKLVKHQNVPDRYVLLTNLQLDDAGKLKEKIESALGTQSKVKVHVLGAADLTALVLNRPHLQQIFFARGPFYSYEEARQMHIRASRAEELSPFVGREAILKDLTASLADPQCRVIVLYGLPQIGKSRLCLEVLGSQERKARSVWASDSLQISADDLRRLEPPKNVVFVVLEDPDELRAEELARHASIREHLKLILTLRRPLPSAEWAWLRQIEVPRLGDQEVGTLIRRIFPDLRLNFFLWLKDFSEGSPGVVVQALAAGVDFDASAGALTRQIGEALEGRLAARLSQDQRNFLSILSLLPQVGVQGHYAEEIEKLSKSASADPADVEAALVDLERERFLIRKGSFVEVVPFLLANHLALEVLRNRQRLLDNLFAQLPPRARLALARRLRGIGGEEIPRLLREFLGPAGAFKDLSALESNPRLLAELSLADPDGVLQCLSRLIKNLSREERKAQITGDTRNYTLSALKDLLYIKDTFSDTVDLLFLLAEEEDEQQLFGERADAVLSEVFHYGHPQTPAPLDERLELLRNLATRYPEARPVLVRIIGQAFSQGLVVIRDSGPGRPYDAEWRPTVPEVQNYLKGILSLLIRLAQESGTPETTREIGAAIARIVEDTLPLEEEKGFESLAFLVDKAKQPESGIEVRDVLSTIERFEAKAERRIQGQHLGEASVRELKEVLARLAQLGAILRESSFEASLKRWAGPLSYGDQRKKHDARREKKENPVQSALEELAAKAEQDLTPELLDWLTSEEAENAFHFFKALGKRDQVNTWLPEIEQRSSRSRGSIALGAYCAGWAETAETGVNKYLDQAAQRSDIDPQAILHATFVVANRATPGSIIRLGSLLEAGKVSPESVAQWAELGGWMEDLRPEEFKPLLASLMKALKPTRERPSQSLVELLLMWDHLHKEKGWPEDLQELGWQLLSTTWPEETRHESYHWDELAAVLSKRQPGRGLRLLEELLRRGNTVITLRLLGEPRRPFLTELSKWNRKNVLRLFLNLSLENQDLDSQMSFSMREEIDPKEDKESLLGLASETGVKGARIIAGWLDAGKDKFWPLAGELIELYPDDDELKRELSSQPYTGFFCGSLAAAYEAMARKAEQLAGETKSPSVRSWARQLARQLMEEVHHEVVWDYDHNIDDLRRFVEDKESPERLWAIGRILQRAPFEEARRLLSLEDIREALPKIELPEKKRKALETALRYWDSDQ